MRNKIDCIDTSYDELFENSSLYPWLPWIGSNFSKSPIKTLILGESTYNWSQEEATRLKIGNRIKDKEHLRILHIDHAINSESSAPFVRNIERAIFQNKKPKEAKQVWLNVAYHNLVLRAMLTKKGRPSFDDYKKGWNTFLDLSAKIDIDQCIVYGLEYSKIKAFLEILTEQKTTYTLRKIKPGVGRNYPRLITYVQGDKTIKIIFIRHPSSYFSWRKWGAILNKELDIMSFAPIRLQQTI